MKMKIQAATIAVLMTALAFAGGASGEGGPLNGVAPANTVCDATLDNVAGDPGDGTCDADDAPEPFGNATDVVDGVVDEVDTTLAGLPTDPPEGCDPADPETWGECAPELPLDDLCEEGTFPDCYLDQIPDPEDFVPNPEDFGTAASFDDAPDAFAGIEFIVTGTFSEGQFSDAASFQLNLTVDDGNGAVDISSDVVQDGGTFSAPYTGVVGTYTFEVTTSYEEDEAALFGASDTLTVDVVAGGGTVVTVPVGDSDTTFSLDTTSFVAPTAGASSGTTFDVVLEDLNGVDTLQDEPTATLGGPGFTAQALVNQTPVDSGEGTTIRTYTYDIAFPAVLKDGDYTITASYPGATDLTYVFTVANVGPGLDVTPGMGETANDQGFEADVDLTVSDDNWGAFDGSAVTELADITFTASPAGDISFEADTGSGFNALPGGFLNLSAVAASGSNDLTLRIIFDGTGAPGTIDVTAVATDDDLDATASTPVFTLTVVPSNLGFFLDVDDGGNGTAVAAAEPGQTTNSSTDPLEVFVSGTIAATDLVLDVPDFTSSSDSFSAEGVTVKVYANSDLSDAPPLTGTVAGNSVSLALDGLGVAGSTMYLVFEVDIPLGTESGDYSTAVTVTGIQ